jgi:hypothetical protein
MKKLLLLFCFSISLFATNEQYIQLMAFNKISNASLNNLLSTLTNEEQERIYIDKKGTAYLLKMKNPTLEDINNVKKVFPEYFFTFLISNKAYKYNKSIGISYFINDIQKSAENISKISYQILNENINENFKNQDLLKNYYLNCYQEIEIKNGRNINIPKKCQIFSFPFLTQKNDFFNVGILQKDKIQELNNILTEEENKKKSPVVSKETQVNKMLINEVDLPNIRLPQNSPLSTSNINDSSTSNLTNTDHKIYPIQSLEPKEITKIVQPIIIEQPKQDKDENQIKELSFLSNKVFLIGLFSGFIIILGYLVYKDKLGHIHKESYKNNNEESKKDNTTKEIVVHNKLTFVKDINEDIHEDIIDNYSITIQKEIKEKEKEEEKEELEKEEEKEELEKEKEKEELEKEKEEEKEEEKLNIKNMKKTNEYQKYLKLKSSNENLEKDLINLKNCCKITQTKVENLKQLEKEYNSDSPNYKKLLNN